MYAGLEGGVEGLDAVGCEEEDALKVFQEAEEDGDEGVAAYVLGLACLCKDCISGNSVELVKGIMPKNTSASSSSNTAPHECATSSILLSSVSSWCGFVPSSPTLTI